MHLKIIIRASFLFFSQISNSYSLFNRNAAERLINNQIKITVKYKNVFIKTEEENIILLNQML